VPSLNIKVAYKIIVPIGLSNGLDLHTHDACASSRCNNVGSAVCYVRSSDAPTGLSINHPNEVFCGG
jgi:hypothetical protein